MGVANTQALINAYTHSIHAVHKHFHIQKVMHVQTQTYTKHTISEHMHTDTHSKYICINTLRSCCNGAYVVHVSRNYKVNLDLSDVK